MNVRIIKVSEHDKKIKHRRKFKKCSHSVIPVNAQSFSPDFTINKRFITAYRSSKNQWNTIYSPSDFPETNSRSTTRDDVTNSNIYGDKNNVVLNHHQKRNKYKKKRLAIFISICLLVALSILIIPLFFLLHNTKVSSYNSVPLLRWNRTGVTVVGITGSNGTDSDKLNRPWDLALVWSNTIYVTDRHNHRVQRFSLGSSNGVTVAGQTNGTPGWTLETLNSPNSIVVDINHNMFISDASNNRVMFWQKDAFNGTLVAGTGVYGSNYDELKYPYALDYDFDSDLLFVGDHNNDRVMKYSRNNTTGTIVAGGNGRGTNNTQLFAPHAVFFDSLSQSFLIANTGYHNIVRWKLGDSNWTLVAGNMDGTSGFNSTSLYSPTDVKLDPMGNLYVVDRYNHRIQFLTSGNKSGITIAGISTQSGANATMFYNPISLALDNQLNLYVVDQMNHRVQKFLRY